MKKRKKQLYVLSIFNFIIIYIQLQINKNDKEIKSIRSLIKEKIYEYSMSMTIDMLPYDCPFIIIEHYHYQELSFKEIQEIKKQIKQLHD